MNAMFNKINFTNGKPKPNIVTLGKPKPKQLPGPMGLYAFGENLCFELEDVIKFQIFEFVDGKVIVNKCNCSNVSLYDNDDDEYDILARSGSPAPQREFRSNSLAMTHINYSN